MLYIKLKVVSISNHQSHLFGILGLVIGKTEEQVTEIVVGDDRWDLIEEFFKPNGTKKIMWYYQEKPASEYSGKSDTQSQAPPKVRIRKS